MMITRRFAKSLILAATILLLCQVFQNDAFFLDKWDRLKKKWGLPSVFNGLGGSTSGGWGSGSSGLSFQDKGKFAQGVRICINFAANFPQGYQQNTCFYCESYRISQISMLCAGQATIPENINYTQANCIMNSCQPTGSGNQATRLPIATTQVTSQTTQP